MVRAAVRMIHEIGLSVVAEGVETEAELRECRELSVDYIPGLLFSKPLPVEEFVKFIHAHALPKKVRLTGCAAGANPPPVLFRGHRVLDGLCHPFPRMTFRGCP